MRGEQADRTDRHHNRGRIIGGYLDAAGRPRGFLLDDGVYTVIHTSAFPALSYSVSTTTARSLDINDRRQIVGIFP